MIETTVDHHEVVALVIFLIGYIPICVAYIQKRETVWLFAGYSLLVLRAALSIVEVFYFQYEINYMEHVFGIMLSGIIFFLCARLSYKRLKKIQSKVYTSIRTGRRKTYKTEERVKIW